MSDPCSGASLDFVGQVRWLDGSTSRLFKSSLPDYNFRAFGPSAGRPEVSHERKSTCAGDSGGYARSRFQSVPETKNAQHNYRLPDQRFQPDEYKLVDEKGVANIVSSVSVHLDSYVGKSVTLTGDQSAMPTSDSAAGRPMPHFKVIKVKPASGSCKK
jgi:hypothetical protein